MDEVSKDLVRRMAEKGLLWLPAVVAPKTRLAPKARGFCRHCGRKRGHKAKCPHRKT